MMNGPIKGAFLQISNDHAGHEGAAWKEAIKAMHRLQMELVIIQTEAYLERDNSRNKVEREYISAALEQAEALNMKVWIGLIYPQGCVGNPSCVKDEACIDRVIKYSKESANLIFEKWGNRSSFDGFYLASEGWTPGDNGELGFFKKYLKEVSEHCRSKGAGLQIATSPFINQPSVGKEIITENVYKSFLKETDLTHILLQDGVGGEHEVPLDVVPAYMNAMKNACDDAGIEMWANIEAFLDKSLSQAASFERVQKQIAAAHTATDNLVTFEFYQFWTKLPGAVELNEAYYKKYIDTTP